MDGNGLKFISKIGWSFEVMLNFMVGTRRIEENCGGGRRRKVEIGFSKIE